MPYIRYTSSSKLTSVPYLLEVWAPYSRLPYKRYNGSGKPKNVPYRLEVRVSYPRMPYMRYNSGSKPIIVPYWLEVRLPYSLRLLYQTYRRGSGASLCLWISVSSGLSVSVSLIFSLSLAFSLIRGRVFCFAGAQAGERELGDRLGHSWGHEDPQGTGKQRKTSISNT